MVGKSSWNVVHYTKPTEFELANPDIPKFKIDGNKIVPETTTNEVMVEKKVTSIK